MKKVVLLVFMLILGKVYANNPEILVLDKENKDPIPYANICFEEIKTQAKFHAVTTVNGIVKNPVQNQSVIAISFVGYKTIIDTIKQNESKEYLMELDLFNLEEITVTGTRTPHTLKNAPILTQMVTRKEIERIDAITITDILETEVPGLEVGRHGYGQSISVQGLEPQYTLFLIDGERMAGETGGNIDYSRINAANIEKIEILRGASSALYGSNAMGGVINIITKKPNNKLEFSANLRYAQTNQDNYDDNNYYEDYEKKFYKNQDWPNLNGNLSIGFRKNSFYSNTFLNFKSLDGYQLEDREGLKYHYINADTTIVNEKGTSSINGMMDYTLTQKFGYDDGKKWAFEIRGNYYKHEEFPINVSNWTHDLYKNYTVGGFAKYNINKNQKVHFTYNTDIYDKYDVYERRSDSAALNYRNGFHNAKLNYTVNIGTKHNLFIGIESLFETLETDMFISDASKLISKSANDEVIVLQDEYQLTNKIQTILGLRTGYHSTFNFHTSPSVTIKYDLKPVKLRVNYARGYRSPTLKELYMNWSHLGMFQIVGSTNLEPETNNYFAFSTDYLNTKRKLNTTLIASYNQIENKIDGIWTDEDTVEYINFDKIKIANIEALVKWRLHNFFNIKGGYVYTKQFKDDEVVALSEVSPHAITTQLEFLYSRGVYRISANLSGKYYSKKNVEGQNDDEDSPLYEQTYEIRYPSYSMWNLTINQQLGKHVTVNLGVKNLFDYTSPTVTMNTSPSIGRRYFISLGYKL